MIRRPPRSTLFSLHDALPISIVPHPRSRKQGCAMESRQAKGLQIDRKSTRLNSSHDQISYAVFCLKKKTQARLADGMALEQFVHNLVQDARLRHRDASHTGRI